MTSSKPAARLALAALVGLAAAAGAQQDESPELGWSDTAELSFVATAGNSEATTLGFKNELRWRGDRAEARLEARGLKAESTVDRRTAVGTPDRFVVQETSLSETTAERYHLRARYDREISERLFWFVGGGWERNEFAGFSRRLTAVAGVGHTWFDRDGARFRTDYGVTWTEQRDLVADPGSDEGFLGLRFSWEYERRLTASTTYVNALEVDENLDRTEDWRADLDQAIKVSISESVALQIGFEVLYDHLPSLERIPLIDPDGAAAGVEVLVPREEVDTSLTMALVVGF